MYLQKVRKTFFLNKIFVGVLKVNGENSRIGTDPDPLLGGMDPDLYQNVVDLQHCFQAGSTFKKDKKNMNNRTNWCNQ
jgi:hypothetical protein